MNVCMYVCMTAFRIGNFDIYKTGLLERIARINPIIYATGGRQYFNRTP